MNKKAIKEFQEIYRKKFGEEIDDLKAREVARKLLNLFKVIYKPTQKNQSGKNN